MKLKHAFVSKIDSFFFHKSIPLESQKTDSGGQERHSLKSQKT